MIFQGEIPAYDEVKSMFISILGDEEEEGGSCGTGCGTGGCGSCGTEEEEEEAGGCGSGGCSSH
jgi:hypothetical protein